MAERQPGTVKWFSEEKGFGFITTEAGDEVFVHLDAIKTTGHKVLKEEQRVTFTPVQAPRGMQAGQGVPEGQAPPPLS